MSSGRLVIMLHHVVMFMPLCQPHRHHHARDAWIHEWKTRGCETLCVSCPWIQYKSSVAGLDLGKLSTKCTGLYRELDFHLRVRKNWGVAYQTAARVWFHVKAAKKTQFPEQRGIVPYCQRCAKVALLLCGFATGCDTTHWRGCAQQSKNDASTLLARGVATGDCSEKK